MTDHPRKHIGRRDVLLALTGAVGAAAASTASITPAQAASRSKSGSARARYQPSSADVQNFYRVNRYPAK